MKKTILMALCLVATLSAAALDRLYINDFTISPGETKTVEIMLDNDSSYTNLQADIYLPQGLTIEQTDGDYLFLLTSRKGSDHAVASTTLSSGAVRLLITSPGLHIFSGNSGALVTFNITASDTFTGSATIEMRNILATDQERVLHHFPNAACTVTKYEPPVVTSLATSSCDIPQGMKVKFNVTVAPIDAENKTLAWTSSDETIATVAPDGTIETLAMGTVTITATTTDGTNLAINYIINVTESQLPQPQGNPLDVNGDGNVTAADITLIYNHLLGN